MASSRRSRNPTAREDSSHYLENPSKCGSMFNLNHADCDAAYNTRADSCGGGGSWVAANSAISAVRGSVVT
ncbi:hypothetical protein B0H63DRAFT_528900 [Podospora didyma]|uniref:Uncharacterized protein n=1 Tax=Podospora didyma TaxID=330526 RepID=A0AAE0N2P8_9PEZI|nr:hypothetical protein B0H63DRAFT_528900 [Podospora didyma]